jgi:uncharacterized membrane protein YeaQ/YmgE (transglycosylase-associated protein family)
MGTLGWILVGLIVGTVAKLMTKNRGGWVTTLTAGLIGAVIGGWLGSYIGKDFNNFWSPWSWALATVGAVVVVWIFDLVAKRRRYP